MLVSFLRSSITAGTFPDPLGTMGAYEPTDQSHSFIDMIHAHSDQSYTCYEWVGK